MIEFGMCRIPTILLDLNSNSIASWVVVAKWNYVVKYWQYIINVSMYCICWLHQRCVNVPLCAQKQSKSFLEFNHQKNWCSWSCRSKWLMCMCQFSTELGSYWANQTTRKNVTEHCVVLVVWHGQGSWSYKKTLNPTKAVWCCDPNNGNWRIQISLISSDVHCM